MVLSKYMLINSMRPSNTSEINKIPVGVVQGYVYLTNS